MNRIAENYRLPYPIRSPVVTLSPEQILELERHALSPYLPEPPKNHPPKPETAFWRGAQRRKR